jgi:hypothetical protein
MTPKTNFEVKGKNVGVSAGGGPLNSQVLIQNGSGTQPFIPSQSTNYFSIKSGTGIPPAGPSNPRLGGGFGMNTASGAKRTSQRNSMFLFTDNFSQGRADMYKTQ